LYDATRWFSINRRDLTPVLDRLGTPTLLATNHHDPLWTVADTRAAAGHLQRGGLVILPGAGHIGPLLQAAPIVVELAKPGHDTRELARERGITRVTRSLC
jgi:pimeloyl-ACP methyl ester carboxylesterase